MAARPRPQPTRPLRSLRPLRWGTHLGRSLGGLTLVVGGAMAIAGSNTFTLWLLGLGTAAHAAGWAVMPGSGLRRLAAAIVSTLAVWLLISGNPLFVGTAVVPYLSWLHVTAKPPLAWATAVIPVGGAVVAGLLFAPLDHRGMLGAIGVMAAAIAVGATAAALISRRNPSLDQ